MSSVPTGREKVRFALWELNKLRFSSNSKEIYLCQKWTDTKLTKKEKIIILYNEVNFLIHHKIFIDSQKGNQVIFTGEPILFYPNHHLSFRLHPSFFKRYMYFFNK